MQKLTETGILGLYTNHLSLPFANESINGFLTTSVTVQIPLIVYINVFCNQLLKCNVVVSFWCYMLCRNMRLKLPTAVLVSILYTWWYIKNVADDFGHTVSDVSERGPVINQGPHQSRIRRV